MDSNLSPESLHYHSRLPLNGRLRSILGRGIGEHLDACDDRFGRLRGERRRFPIQIHGRQLLPNAAEIPDAHWVFVHGDEEPRVVSDETDRADVVSIRRFDGVWCRMISNGWRRYRGACSNMPRMR